MDRKTIIKKYLDFFKLKNHKEIKNSSLVPENDPTVLFTTAGMHPLVPFLLGESHPLGKKLVNVQRCIRTGDIDQVGNTTHHTFFEMLGNWSLGEYFKKEAIEYSFEFLKRELKIPIEKLAVTVFEGDENSPRDEESAKIWNDLGVPKERIAFLPKKDNWWGPAGNTGPCGPDTEIFYWKPQNIPVPKKFDPEDKNWVEIWNDVLMGYEKTKEGEYILAKQKNIDTGMGVERIVTILNGYEDNYLSDMWKPIINQIEKLSSKNYFGNEKEMRIIADHLKASVFIIADGIKPSNSEQGYVLRRLLRRATLKIKKLNIKFAEIEKIIDPIFKIYEDYEIIKNNKEKINEEIKKEIAKFEKTLEKGLNEFNKMIKGSKISGKESFLLFQSYGFPIEMTKELAEEKKITFNEKEFQKELEIHQELSRTASTGKFKSGLADNSEKTTQLHTASHLLLAALNKTLKREIFQKGSNITPERLRFDFNFDRKLTEQEKEKIEQLINKEINKNQEVIREEMSPDEAKRKGATGIFDDKYGEKISVYSIGNFSKEICSGPHVKNTKELGKFKIIKEESSSLGIRRIKAILE